MDSTDGAANGAESGYICMSIFQWRTRPRGGSESEPNGTGGGMGIASLRQQ